MGNVTFVGHLFIPQKSILSENPLKICSKTRLLYHEDTLFIATREENSSNLKITNLLIYTLEADKRLHLLTEYSLKIPIDNIIGIDKTKMIVYGLSIEQNSSAFCILKIDILNHAEVNLYEIKLLQFRKTESKISLNQIECFCQTKILDGKYSIFTIDCLIETMNKKKKDKSYLFFFDSTVEKIYYLSYISEKFIKEIEIVQTTLLGGKYILFQTGRIGDSEKFDIIFEAIQEKKENFELSNFRVNQKMIIYPLRKFFEDISIRNVDLERYCFERMDFNVVVPTCCRWFENDEFFYIKTFITQNKSELIRVKVSRCKNKRNRL
ncbi:hypothetical protein [Caldicellulosiruptor morganii]|uniref:Uncharacterized protein n=1 Tax=Caldicellulosiruptor morganii TaxID=1387555 RepID=A0ABY7BQS1_9FIRM|nr:hypothetical protein [Caldicellulosiruptor morganii]WAM33391.1 hypothetical protein OTK00_001888 [Caldicellulosiruptor morganii]WAM34466.1 hypothetical protein OTK00_000671 [Caldicellulosiruptor morganii]